MDKGIGTLRRGFGFIKGSTQPPKFNNLLIIGIDEYKNQIPPLNNAVRDAKEFKELMEEKYSVKNTISLFNEEATSENILNAFDLLRESLTNKDNLVVYYSGHGELHSNRGYWLPANAIGGKRHTYFPNHYVKDLLKDLKAFHVVVIVDACFSGSLLAKVRSHKASRYYNMPSRWVMTSGQVEPVSDGDPGAHSPFAKSLITQLKHAKKQHLSLSELWVNMREGIVTNSYQTPACEPVRDVDHQGGEYYFIDQHLNDSLMAEEVTPEGRAVEIVNKIPRWILILIPLLLIGTVIGSMMFNKAMEVGSKRLIIEYPQVSKPYYQAMEVKEDLTIEGLKKAIWNKYILTRDSGQVYGDIVLENGIAGAQVLINKSSKYNDPKILLKDAGINSGDTVSLKEFDGLIASASEVDLWNEVRKDASLEAYKQYLQKYPEGKHKKEASEKVKELEDEAAWSSATEANTPESYESYLKKYPNSLHKPVAKSKIEELKWDAASKANTENSFQAYKIDYPDGKYFLAAEDRIKQLKKAEEKSKKDKIERRKKEGLLAAFDLKDSNFGGYNRIDNIKPKINAPECFKSAKENSTMINNFGSEDCSNNEPGCIIVPHVNFSESFSFCAWIYPEVTSQGWIVGQSGKRPDIDDAWATMFIGSGLNADNTGNKNYGSYSKVSLLIPHKTTPLHIMDSKKIEKKWTFFVVTVAKNGHSTTAIMYRDGNEVSRETEKEVYKNPGKNALLIANGSSDNEGYMAYSGKLKKVKVYDRVLTRQDIDDLYKED